MNFFYAFSRSISLFLLKFLFRLEVKGKENIPLTGKLILASNHESYLDPIVIGVSLPRELYFLGKESLFKVKFLSWLVRNLNVLPISEEKTNLSATKKSLKNSLKILKRGGALLLFPEGTRTSPGEILDGRRGVGLIALTSGAAVVPVFIKGSGKALPKGKRWISSHKIWVIFGKPLNFEKLKREGKKKEIYQEISNEVMDKIRELSCSHSLPSLHLREER